MPIDASVRCGCPGIAGGSLRLLEEPGDALGLVHRDDAEALAVLDRHFDRGQRDLRPHVLMEAEHLLVIHLVDVVAREHDDVARVLADDRIQVLVDGVGGALIPVLADALLRRQDLDELAELLRHHGPALADVAVERERLVLGRDEDVAQSRVDAVAQDEVDDAVGAAEIHRRLGAIPRERGEPFAGAACQHDYEDVIAQHAVSETIPSRGLSHCAKPLL